MNGQASRAQALIQDILLLKGIEKYSKKIVAAFKPFERDIKTSSDFGEWKNRIETAPVGLRSDAETIFLEEVESADTFINKNYGYTSPDIRWIFAGYSIFREIPNEHLSFQVKQRIVDDVENAYTHVEIEIHAGATQKEVVEHVKRNWGTIAKAINRSEVAKDTLLSKRVRARSHIDRDKRIIELREKGFTDRQISGQLADEGNSVDGNLSLIRKVISTAKKKRQL